MGYRKQVRFICDDGTEFTNEADAQAYDKALSEADEAEYFIDEVICLRSRRRTEYLNILKRYILWKGGAPEPDLDSVLMEDEEEVGPPAPLDKDRHADSALQEA